ncbi:MAG: Hpt domain-containing protein [Rhodothalassiaceae bacterium]
MTEATVAALREKYLDWTGEALDQMHGMVTGLEETVPGEDARLTGIFEIAHNLKGMGSSFGFPAMSDLGHLMCLYLRHGYTRGTRVRRALLADQLGHMQRLIADARNAANSDWVDPAVASVKADLHREGVPTA